MWCWKCRSKLGSSEESRFSGVCLFTCWVTFLLGCVLDLSYSWVWSFFFFFVFRVTHPRLTSNSNDPFVSVSWILRLKAYAIPSLFCVFKIGIWQSVFELLWLSYYCLDTQRQDTLNFALNLELHPLTPFLPIPVLPLS